MMFTMVSCYKSPDELGGTGFLSDYIRLQGTDTIIVNRGSKMQTSKAWTDNSSTPLKFKIVDVFDQKRNVADAFFTPVPYMTWIKPYDNKVDTTKELILAKLSEQMLQPMLINETNGQLTFLETTSGITGDSIYNVNVEVSNSAGSKLYEDYAILKMGPKGNPYVFTRAAVAIIFVDAAGNNAFSMYQQYTDADVRQAVMEGQDPYGLLKIYKTSDEPSTGIKLILRYLDDEEKIYAAEDMKTYSAGTESYFDYSINRVNTESGAVVEFPTTPFPVREDLLGYLRGGTMPMSTVDTASLFTALYNNGEYDYLYHVRNRINGLADNGIDPFDPPFVPVGWYVRLRNNITFYEAGTWVIECRFPYTHIDETF